MAAAGSVAAIYGAIGYKLGLFSGGDETAAAGIKGETDALKREDVKIGHLVRRAGFGASADEMEHYRTLGLQGTLDEIIGYANVNDDASLALASQVPVVATQRASVVPWWLVRMASTRRPLQEKMVLFWHGLLTSQLSVVRDPLAMQAQNEFFRAHAFDTFPSILRGISMDPAMMVYLDVAGSMRGAPNENYARELMELFSLGIGNYTEQDVREAARAFTGWAVPRNRIDNNFFTLGEPVFRPRLFDDGNKTFLGETGNFRPDDIVDIITKQPASAAFITRRLFSYFVYPNPSDSELKPFLDVYNQSGKSIGAVVEAILRADIFYSPKAYRSLMKSPVEYAVGAIKALDLTESIADAIGAGGNRATAGALGEMGQIPFEPPNVAGWPGGAHWLNSSTLFARLNYVNGLTGGGPATGPNRRAAAALPAGMSTARQTLDRFLPLVLDDNVPDGFRQALIDYAGSEDEPLAPERLRGLVYMVLASPQFHLA